MLSASEFQELLLQADQSFISKCAERMEVGAERYGPLNFLSVDTLEEAMAEVLDLANYARMTYLKLFLLQKQAAKINADNPVIDNQGFISTKEFNA